MICLKKIKNVKLQSCFIYVHSLMNYQVKCKELSLEHLSYNFNEDEY